MRACVLLVCLVPSALAAQVNESVGVNAHLPDDAMLDASAALGVE